MKSNLISRLLYKNTSVGRIAGFVISNFLGLAIVLGGLQFYLDSRSLWEDEESFIRSDYMVINKHVTSENTFGGRTSEFTTEEIKDLELQPWVKRVAPFSKADYKIYASISQGDKGISTNMFFESIPDSFVDVPSTQWQWREGSDEIPVIISKDYLTLYNFGFASSAGLPQMSEGLMSGIPLSITLRSNDGMVTRQFHGRVAGYSNRLNTILVPQNFMKWSNDLLGGGDDEAASRLIVEVSSPGDVAIEEYLDAKGLEVAGDKRATSASFLLKIVVGIVLAIGIIITVLSFFILLLSISLLMEKNRQKLHRLLMLGYELRSVADPYRLIAIFASCVAMLLSIGAMLLMRHFYLMPIVALGAEAEGVWISVATGVLLTFLIVVFNLIAIRNKVRNAWRI